MSKTAKKTIAFGPEDAPETGAEAVASEADNNNEPEFIVEEGFGIPPRLRAFRGESKYPIKTLKVEDAIVGTEKVVRGAAVAARTFRKLNPETKFSMYKLASGKYALVRTA